MPSSRSHRRRKSHQLGKGIRFLTQLDSRTTFLSASVTLLILCSLRVNDDLPNPEPAITVFIWELGVLGLALLWSFLRSNDREQGPGRWQQSKAPTLIAAVFPILTGCWLLVQTPTALVIHICSLCAILFGARQSFDYLVNRSTHRAAWLAGSTLGVAGGLILAQGFAEMVAAPIGFIGAGALYLGVLVKPTPESETDILPRFKMPALVATGVLALVTVAQITLHRASVKELTWLSAQNPKSHSSIECWDPEGRITYSATNISSEIMAGLPSGCEIDALNMIRIQSSNYDDIHAINAIQNTELYRDYLQNHQRFLALSVTKTATICALGSGWSISRDAARSVGASRFVAATGSEASYDIQAALEEENSEPLRNFREEIVVGDERNFIEQRYDAFDVIFLPTISEDNFAGTTAQGNKLYTVQGIQSVLRHLTSDGIASLTLRLENVKSATFLRTLSLINEVYRRRGVDFPQDHFVLFRSIDRSSRSTVITVLLSATRLDRKRITRIASARDFSGFEVLSGPSELVTHNASKLDKNALNQISSAVSINLDPQTDELVFVRPLPTLQSRVVEEVYASPLQTSAAFKSFPFHNLDRLINERDEQWNALVSTGWKTAPVVFVLILVASFASGSTRLRAVVGSARVYSGRWALLGLMIGALATAGMFWVGSLHGSFELPRQSLGILALLGVALGASLNQRDDSESPRGLRLTGLAIETAILLGLIAVSLSLAPDTQTMLSRTLVTILLPAFFAGFGICLGAIITRSMLALRPRDRRGLLWNLMLALSMAALSSLSLWWITLFAGIEIPAILALGICAIWLIRLPSISLTRNARRFA